MAVISAGEVGRVIKKKHSDYLRVGRGCSRCPKKGPVGGWGMARGS